KLNGRGSMPHTSRSRHLRKHHSQLLPQPADVPVRRAGLSRLSYLGAPLHAASSRSLQPPQPPEFQCTLRSHDRDARKHQRQCSGPQFLYLWAGLFHFEHVSCLPGLHQAQLLASEMKSFHRPAYERGFSFIYAANGVSPVSDARVVLQKLRPPAVLALLAAPLLLRAEGQPLLHFVLIKCNLFPDLNPLRCPPNE